jgi:hypothetical protein
MSSFFPCSGTVITGMRLLLGRLCRFFNPDELLHNHRNGESSRQHPGASCDGLGGLWIWTADGGELDVCSLAQ